MTQQAKQTELPKSPQAEFKVRSSTPGLLKTTTMAAMSAQGAQHMVQTFSK